MSIPETQKFGTIKGVFIPNITMMFGVILFLRLGVLTASAGPLQMLLIIALSLTIMVLTSFSIGALATNMHVESGGVYYIISRTLGIELGGAIGLVLYFAQLISITLTVAGFSLSIHDLYPDVSLQLIELMTLTGLALLSGFSASWALSIQGVILALLLAAIGSVLLGSPTWIPQADAPLRPFYPPGSLNFWQTFALFYPAMTGIEAGMALSGSLRTPGRSLYLGNLASLVFVAFCYAGLALFAAWRIPYEILASDPFSFVSFARWPQLVFLGIWGATLSSALGCLLGAPRMLQSMAEDGILPERLGATYGPHREPRMALFVTYASAAILLFFTTIDQIIPMLAMICLISYGLLNFVTGFAELMNTPSWRPELRISWIASFTGFMLIVITMFMTAPGWAFITLLILTTAYFALHSRKLETSFQDLRESLLFFISRITLYRLGEPTEHALTWHPQLLTFISSPTQQDQLIHLSHCLTRRSGILTFTTVVPEEWQSPEKMQYSKEALKNQFERLGIACLTEVYPASSNFEGYCQLVKAYGIGSIQPNTVVLEIEESDLNGGLIRIIETCQYMQKNLILVRDSAICPTSIFSSRRGSRKKRIDVWWDPNETTNFDLTMSLVTTLTDGLAFGGAQLTIKSHVSDPNAEEWVSDYLTDYLEKSRLKATLVISSEDITTPPPGHLSFVSMKPLGDAPNSVDKLVYLDYLRDLFHSSDRWQVTAFVTSYDQVDHRAIYYPAQEG